jgi:TonB family protein
MNIRCFLIATAALSALIPASVQAREWGSVAGWVISPGKQSCGMFSQKHDGTMTDALFLKRLDGSIVMQLENPSWQIPAGSVGRVQYWVNNRNYRGPVSAAAMPNNPGRGLIAAFGADFENELSSGSVLILVLDGRPVDQISLAGSAAAIDTVQSCLNELRTAPTQGAGFTALAAKAPVPRNSPSQWITVEDYPSSAERDRREGTVAFRLSVGMDGRADNCVVTKSSGSEDLDAATCKAMMRRTKFNPALDATGNPVAGIYESRVSWKLPGA